MESCIHRQAEPRRQGLLAVCPRVPTQKGAEADGGGVCEKQPAMDLFLLAQGLFQSGQPLLPAARIQRCQV